MDNTPWNKKIKRLVYDEAQLDYADILENMLFIMLLPYPIDLNPIEQVWCITRIENMHNTILASISILDSTVDSNFASWAVPNDQLRSLCFLSKFYYYLIAQ